MFGLRFMFGFFLVFLEFFWFFFGHDLEKNKKTQGFFGFLDKLMVKELWKTKKNSGLFWFFAWIVVTCLLKICRKTKKDLSFFGFSQFFNHQFIQKTKKTLSFFSFFKVMTQKTKKLEENQKNQTWASDQTFSEKFWFFGFLEVLWLSPWPLS